MVILVTMVIVESVVMGATSKSNILHRREKHSISGQVKVGRPAATVDVAFSMVVTAVQENTVQVVVAVVVDRLQSETVMIHSSLSPMLVVVVQAATYIPSMAVQVVAVPVVATVGLATVMVVGMTVVELVSVETVPTKDLNRAVIPMVAMVARKPISEKQ
jgi:hypothetical protein